MHEQVAARLKAIQPAIKILFYHNVDQFPCYSPTDPAVIAFEAHPEWWLKDDNGNVVTPKGLDFTNEKAVEFWLSIPTNAVGAFDVIDGVLADGIVPMSRPNMSAARLAALTTGKYEMAGRLNSIFNTANGGLVVANGMTGGPIDPTDPMNLRALNATGGIENEHFGVFEQVNHQTGGLNMDVTAANLAALEQAGLVANGSKIVAFNAWPGPIIGFDTNVSSPGHGLPTFSPNDPDNKPPTTGTQAQIYAWWRAQLEKYLPFNLAAFLTIAGPGTYFTQMVWYASFQGFVPCPEAPDTCMGPTPWYPMMSQPLGAPQGPRVQLGPYKWRRTFAHAIVTLDLAEPLGPGTAIQWGTTSV